MGCLVFFGLGSVSLWAQHTNLLKVSLNGETKEITIQQEFVYENTSSDTLNLIYFNDWSHAYSDKKYWLSESFCGRI